MKKTDKGLEIVPITAQVPASNLPPLVSLLASSDDIRSMLNGGYTIRRIWLDMLERKKTTYSYESFRRQVNRHVRSKAAEPSVPTIGPPIGQPVLLQGRRSNQSGGPQQTPLDRKFVITLNPKKEDLI